VKAISINYSYSFICKRLKKFSLQVSKQFVLKKAHSLFFYYDETNNFENKVEFLLQGKQFNGKLRIVVVSHNLDKGK
jgi:hypothetical protein